MIRKFGLLRRLQQAEQYLDGAIDRASVALADGHEPEKLARAFRRGRPARHHNWPMFVLYARPINEAREHIADERERLSGEIAQDFNEGIRRIRR